MKDNVKIEVKAAEGNVLTILEGAAKKIRDRKNVEVNSVDIDAPAKYWNRKKDLYDPIKAHILFDTQKGIIKMILAEDNSEQLDTVTGRLSLNPELNKLNINKEDWKNHKEFLSLIKWSLPFFEKSSDYIDLVKKLTVFKAKVETEIDRSEDKTGNKSDSIITKVSHDVNMKFALKAKIYLGQSESLFPVEIIARSSNGSLVFALESMEYYEEEIRIRESAIDAVLKQITEIVAIEATL